MIKNIKIHNIIDIHNEKSRPLKPHYSTTKTQKQFIYNYYATISWALQLVCIYPLRNIMY